MNSDDYYCPILDSWMALTRRNTLSAMVQSYSKLLHGQIPLEDWMAAEAAIGLSLDVEEVLEATRGIYGKS